MICISLTLRSLWHGWSPVLLMDNGSCNFSTSCHYLRFQWSIKSKPCCTRKTHIKSRLESFVMCMSQAANATCTFSCSVFHFNQLRMPNIDWMWFAVFLHAANSSNLLPYTSSSSFSSSSSSFFSSSASFFSSCQRWLVTVWGHIISCFFLTNRIDSLFHRFRWYDLWLCAFRFLRRQRHVQFNNRSLLHSHQQ